MENRIYENMNSERKVGRQKIEQAQDVQSAAVTNQT